MLLVFVLGDSTKFQEVEVIIELASMPKPLALGGFQWLRGTCCIGENNNDIPLREPNGVMAEIT